MKILNIKRFSISSDEEFDMYIHYEEQYNQSGNCVSVLATANANIDIVRIEKNGIDVSSEWGNLPSTVAAKRYTSNITETLTFYGNNGSQKITTINVSSIETQFNDNTAIEANISINPNIKINNLSLGEIDTKVAALFDLIYPVGSIYYTENANFNPNIGFCGTWELIKDRFLLGAGGNYSLGTTGGSNTHNHILSSKGGANIRKYGNTFYQGDYTTAGTMPPQTDGHWWLTTGNADTSSTTNPGTKGIGVGLYGTTDDKNTLPPYLAVYIWKRVS